MRATFNKKSIKDTEVNNKRVLIRIDGDVGVDADDNIIDDTRIQQALPTLKYLISHGAQVIITAHLGRPKGKRSEEFSLKPVAKHLSKLLNKDIPVVDDFLTQSLPKLNNGDLCLLENMRFYPGEKSNDYDFSKKLAALADIFVNEAFATCHRKHASVVGITEFLPSVSGLALEKEIEMLGNNLTNPKRPFVSLMGGAKGETKITLIDSLLDRADAILIGGAIANTFIKAAGYKIGESLFEPELLDTAAEILHKAKDSKCKLLLPTDLKLGHFGITGVDKIVDVANISDDMQALDIGPSTTDIFKNILNTAQTIVWNGPVGVSEQPEFAESTDELYDCMVNNTNAIKIFGGGDTLDYLKSKSNTDKIDHISTGGGSMLTFIEKGTLVAIDALDNL